MDMTLETQELREEAESQMTDECQVSRIGVSIGTPTLDPVTGMYPLVGQQVVYTGKAMLRVPGTVSTGKVRPSAGDNASLLLGIFSIPWDAPQLRINDVVAFTASENPSLVGLVYSVMGLLPSSHVTKQRVSVELVAD